MYVSVRDKVGIVISYISFMGKHLLKFLSLSFVLDPDMYTPYMAVKDQCLSDHVIESVRALSLVHCVIKCKQNALCQ